MHNFRINTVVQNATIVSDARRKQVINAALTIEDWRSTPRPPVTLVYWRRAVISSKIKRATGTWQQIGAQATRPECGTKFSWPQAGPAQALRQWQIPSTQRPLAPEQSKSSWHRDGGNGGGGGVGPGNAEQFGLLRTLGGRLTRHPESIFCLVVGAHTHQCVHSSAPVLRFFKVCVVPKETEAGLAARPHDTRLRTLQE